MKALNTSIRILLLLVSITSSTCIIAANGGEEGNTKTATNKNSSERKRKIKRLQKFTPSIKEGDDLSSFSYHQKSYVIEMDVETVWNTYINVKPNEAWKGPLNTFKQSYSKSRNLLFDSTSTELPCIELGMVYELNLKLAKLLNVGVAFQITELNEAEKIIEFTYGKDNKSHGRQRIVFKKEGNKTFIIHYSNFKSDSKFRDKHLYPKFHEKCMDEFHANLHELIKLKTKTQQEKGIIKNQNTIINGLAFE